MSIQAKNFIEFLNDNFKKYDSFHLHEPNFSGNEKKYVINSIDSTYVSSVGREIRVLEEKISCYTKNKFSLACVNGTSALHMSLKIAGVCKGHEVITQALSFVATANSISYLNAIPIFIDVDIDTMGMSPVALKDFLENNVELRKDGSYNVKTGRKISACLPMHTFGFVCRIDEIKKICKKWKINLVEDSAEAFGSKYKGINAGKFGLSSSYSFNGNKIITSGGGGCIVTQNKILHKQAKHLITTAKSSKNWEFIHDELGYNYRMPNLNAALLLGQLEQIDNKIKSKKKLYEFYKKSLPNLGIELVTIPKNNSWNYWMMSVKLNSQEERERFLSQTNLSKVYTRPIWKLLFKLPMYKNFQRDAQKNALELEKVIVNIPSNLNLD